jgi:mRNA-degrading endonuclease toxin of MazEF toxin-antitoxin module
MGVRSDRLAAVMESQPDPTPYSDHSCRQTRRPVGDEPADAAGQARSFRPAIEIAGQAARVLVEQTTAIAPDRLGRSLGRLTAAEPRDVDTALGL